MGGFAPACVATLASVLLADAYAQSPIGAARLLVFALEGIGVASLVIAISRRLREARARLAATQAANDELRGHARRGYLTDRARQHLEEMAPDAAVFVVSARGLIVEWPRSAERMYGHTASQMVGSSFGALFSDSPATNDIRDLLMASADPQTRRPAVHRRSDGTFVHVEFEMKPCGSDSAEYVTVAVHDLSRRHEVEAFREAALDAQTALQERPTRLDARSSPGVADRPVGQSGRRSGGGRRASRAAPIERACRRRCARSGRPHRDAPRLPARGCARHGSAHPAPPPVLFRCGRVAIVHNDAARVLRSARWTWPSRSRRSWLFPSASRARGVQN